MTGPRRWPLVLIAAPAAVSIWSGWVGLGAMCGFGLVHPLPGIWPGLRLDTAITLPVGVEAYGAYALGAWLGLAADHPARAFARRSAVGSLVLGMLGQVAYHVLAAAHAHRAPWPVVVLVSCLPVVTLGFGAALTHLLGNPAGELRPRRGHVPHPDSPPEIGLASDRFGAVPEAESPSSAGELAVPGAYLNGSGLVPGEAEPFAADLAAGAVPTIRRIRSELHVGQPRAQEIQARLTALARTP